MLVATTTAVLVAGGAAAYISATGGGTSVVTSPTAIDGVLIGGSASAAIAPEQPVPLDVYLLNSNPFSANVHAVSVSVSRIDSVRHSCSVTDFAVTGPPAAGPIVVPPRTGDGDGVTQLAGASIELRMTDHDQNDCLGSTVYLRYQAR